MSNQFTDLIKSRSSIRKWKSEKIDPAILEDIIACGKAAPSAHDSEPFNNILVSDDAQIEELLSDRLQLIEAPYDINSKTWAEQIGLDKYTGVNSPAHIIVVAGDKNKLDDEQGMLQTLSASAMNILLAAHSYNLGACWLYVHDNTDETERHVKQLLNLPENIKLLCLIAVGYPEL